MYVDVHYVTIKTVVQRTVSIIIGVTNYINFMEIIAGYTLKI